MKIIDIDTMMLFQLTAITADANEAIDKAANELNSISEHWDWECREKDAINAYCVANKQRVKVLQENARHFLDVIKSVTQGFDEAEKGIGDMFSSVEGLIGRITSTVTGAISHINNPFFGDSDHWKDILNDIFTNSTVTDIVSKTDVFNPLPFPTEIPVAIFKSSMFNLNAIDITGFMNLKV